jgi:hypothetical protein
VRLQQVLASATRLKSFNQNFRDCDDEADDDCNIDGTVGVYGDDVVEDAATEIMFNVQSKTPRSKPLSLFSSLASSRPTSALVGDRQSSSVNRHHPQSISSLSSNTSSYPKPFNSMRPASALTTGNRATDSRARRPSSAATPAVANGAKSLEDEAVEVEELQRMVKLLKQQQHGSRENMLLIQQQQQHQQQQQQQQQQQSSAERVAHEYRSSVQCKDDVQQLTTLLQVVFSRA